MGSKKVDKSASVSAEKSKKKVLVHVLKPRLNVKGATLVKEIYQTMLDEVMSTNNFSLLINNPVSIRAAKVKFIEIHSEIKKNNNNLFSVGVYLADGNTGNVISQKELKNMPEVRVRYFIRKSLRSLLYEKKLNKRLSSENFQELNNLESPIDDEGIKKKSDKKIKSGSLFSPLLNKPIKNLNVAGGSGRNKGSKFASEGYQDLVPYAFRKKTKDSGEGDDLAEDSPTKKTKFEKRENTKSLFTGQQVLLDSSDGEESLERFNPTYGLPELMSRKIKRSLTEYAEEAEKINKINTKKTSSLKEKRVGENTFYEVKSDNLKSNKNFKKTNFEIGKTIYSVAVNFQIDQINSADTIQTTNNLKQLGLTATVDSYKRGERGQKISGYLLYAIPIDFDEQYEFPGSIRARVGYHKSFNSFFLGVVGLEYERQSFVNVAVSGNSLQAWENSIIWYNLGFDLEFEVLSRALSFSTYFSKPFVGNTNYGGGDKKTMDGNRVYAKFKLQLFRNISVKSEVFWSEMTSQGFSELKNKHLTTTGHLVYAF